MTCPPLALATRVSGICANAFHDRDQACESGMLMSENTKARRCLSMTEVMPEGNVHAAKIIRDKLINGEIDEGKLDLGMMREFVERYGVVYTRDLESTLQAVAKDLGLKSVME